jgi:hypothetical protein
MSLYKTKPRWHRGEIIATERGWVNPHNNEVLVSIGNLKSKLEAEDRAINIPLEVEQKITAPLEVEQAIEGEMVSEVEVEVLETEVKSTRKYNRKSMVESKKENIMEDPKKEIIGEVVESITDSKKIIGEVVETDLEKQIIAE